MACTPCPPHRRRDSHPNPLRRCSRFKARQFS